MTDPVRYGRPPRLDAAAERRIALRVTGDELAAFARAAGELSIGVWLRGVGRVAAGLDKPARVAAPTKPKKRTR